MVNNQLKLPYEIFNLRMKDKIKEEASSGCYNKWKLKYNKNGETVWIWVKSGYQFFEDYCHEGVMEVIASNLAKDLGIKDVVEYFPCVLNIEELNGNISRSIGCYSFQFTNDNEEVVSFDDLEVSSHNYNNNIKGIAAKTNINELEVRDYIDRCLLIDSLILNIDRHLGNLAVIKNSKTGKYRLCPVFDFGLSMNAAVTTSVDIQDFSDYELDNYRAKPYSVCHDAQIELTHYKDNIDGRIETLHMAEDRKLNNTLKCINKMFICFGTDYLDYWNPEQREKANNYRNIYKLTLPIGLGERHYIISTIKRRIEVVLAGKAMPYKMCQDKIDQEIEMLEGMRYKKG